MTRLWSKWQVAVIKDGVTTLGHALALVKWDSDIAWLVALFGAGSGKKIVSFK